MDDWPTVAVWACGCAWMTAAWAEEVPKVHRVSPGQLTVTFSATLPSKPTIAVWFASFGSTVEVQVFQGPGNAFDELLIPLMSSASACVGRRMPMLEQ